MILPFRLRGETVCFHIAGSPLPWRVHDLCQEKQAVHYNQHHQLHTGECRTQRAVSTQLVLRPLGWTWVTDKNHIPQSTTLTQGDVKIDSYLKVFLFHISGHLIPTKKENIDTTLAFIKDYSTGLIIFTQKKKKITAIYQLRIKHS